MLGGAFTEIDLSDKQCADLIMGTDELIPEFLSLDPDNIVFKQPGSDNYICADRNDIKTQMNDPANLALPCKSTSFALNITPDMVCGLKLSKLQALGVAYGGYVALENMANVVANTTEQVFQIEDYDSPITIKALAGLRLFPEYAPEKVRVPFYPEEDENNDSYVRRLNEWGVENNQPNLGDRWEDASQLLLGATHCQSGYEGQHIYRIVSASTPEYTVNPRLLERMKDTGCIIADSLPPVTEDTPQIDWQSDFLYQDTAEYTPARRLFGLFDQMDESESTEPDGVQMSSESVAAANNIVRNQLDGEDGLGNVLLNAIPGEPEERSQEIVALTSPLSISSALQAINEAASVSEYEQGITYILGYVSEESSSVTYITNLDANLVKLEENQNKFLYLDLSVSDKRNAAISILETITAKANEKAEELQQLSESSASDVELVMDPLMLVVATKSPRTSDIGTKTRIFYVEADEFLDNLMSPELQSQEAWNNWYNSNILSRVRNDSLEVVSGSPVIYDATIENKVGRIEIKFSGDAFTDIGPIKPRIAYLQQIWDSEDETVILENSSNNIDDSVQNDEVLSPIAASISTPVSSTQTSPMPTNNLSLNSSGGKRRRKTKSKRSRKSKKTGKNKRKHTRRRKNNRNK